MVEQELRYPKSHWENMTEGELSNFVLDIYVVQHQPSN